LSCSRLRVVELGHLTLYNMVSESQNAYYKELFSYSDTDSVAKHSLK